MKPFRNSVIALFALACISLLLLAACSTGTTVVGIEQSGDGGAVGPQMIVGATEVMKFDPASIPVADGEAVGGTCAGSTLVPGSYRCELETGGAAEPCFVAGDQRLICAPDPVAFTYGTLVSATGTLPLVPPPPPDRAVQFFIELDTGMTCAIRTGPEPVILGGVTALYDCNEPYTFLMGFEKSAPTWEAAIYTMDPVTGESPSGKVPVNVKRAWVP